MKATIALFCLCLFCIRDSRAQGGPVVKSHNSAVYAGRDKWNWTVWVDAADPAIMNRIASVEYKLDKSFKTRDVKKTINGDDPAHPFSLSATGWGVFDIYITVTFTDGTTTGLIHPLVFKGDRTYAAGIVMENCAHEIEKDWYEWTVFLHPSNVNDLRNIKCVEYTLHNTFKQPVQKICERGANSRQPYALTTKGWGTFAIKARVFYRNDSVTTLEPYMLDFSKRCE